MKLYIVYIKEDISFYEPTLWVFQDKDKAYNLLDVLNEDYDRADIMVEYLS